jgi:capsular polysaccharide biosynthesis protein
MTGRRRWHPAYPSQESGFPPPRCFGPNPVDFGDRVARVFPMLGVLEIPNGAVDCPDGWIYEPHGNLHPECAWFAARVTEMERDRRRPERVERLAGRALSLVSDFSLDNYGHLLVDSLGRLHLYEQAGLRLDDCDHVVCPGRPSARNRALVAQLGIPSAKCRWADEPRTLQFETLWATSFPGVRRNAPAWLAAFLRRRLGAPVASPARRLFVTRAGFPRNVSNEAALLPLLRERGFEIYDPSANENPRRDFAEAALVVGGHGAGLTDILFCAPGATVLELVPSDHVFPYYYAMAHAAQLRYACILGRSLQQRPAGSWGPSPYDFEVDPDVLGEALVALTSG